MWNVMRRPMWRSARVLRASTLVLGLLCLIVADGVAQASKASESARCFEQTVIARLDGRDMRCADEIVPPLAVIMYPNEYSDALVEDMLNAFADLSTSSSNPVVRREAIVWLAYLGQPATSPNPRSGVVAKLRRVYESSETQLGTQGASLNQAMVIALAGKQAERQEAAAFLESVVRGKTSEHHTVEALKALRELGGPGEVSLQRLSEERVPK